MNSAISPQKNDANASLIAEKDFLSTTTPTRENEE